MYQVDQRKGTILHRPSGLQIKVAIKLLEGDWTIDSNFATRAAKIRNSTGFSQSLHGLFNEHGVHLPNKPKKDTTRNIPDAVTIQGQKACVSLVKGANNKFRLATMVPTYEDTTRAGKQEIPSETKGHTDNDNGIDEEGEEEYVEDVVEEEDEEEEEEEE